MSFSIIIPSRNPENLKACITAIRASGCDDEIIAYDDSEDNSMHALGFNPGGYPGQVAYYRESERKPFCFARAINEALRVVDSDSDVVIMNDDALLKPQPASFNPRAYRGRNSYLETLGSPLDWLARAAEGFGLVSAAVMGKHKASEIEPMEYPSLKALDPMADLLYPRAVSPMVPFICVYIPRSTIDKVGLLDERFTDYGGEDDDYCYRVRKAGLKIGAYDGCVVDHGTLPSTFRPDGKGRDVSAARQTFREIHGFEMGTR